MPTKITSKGTATAAKEPAANKEAPTVAGQPAAAAPSTPPPSEPPAKKKGGSAEIAAQLAAGTAEPGLAHYARALEDENPNAAAQAARVLEELANLKPELCAPHIERFVRLLASE